MVDPFGAITAADLARLYSLRAEIFKEIRKCLEIDSYHKSYEGCLEISLPNYFESYAYEDLPPNTERTCDWGLTLHCYVMCSGRRETWTGTYFSDCLEQAEDWLKEYRASEGKSGE